MSYQVLARKWRPKSFSETAGQEHVLQALINALDNDRLHHAYLFTGTRGVGKTTIARILSKCLNCEKGVSSVPCGECSSCNEIDEGRFIDLIEVDAASRTGVDDMRDLLDNVQYSPSRGRYKIYLIDEVHMLSKSSFAALLKTLEEPPPHVKFLFATTDPQKLPITVLSRCLQFNLKNLSPARIAEHLQFVLGEEKVPFDEGGVWAIGRAADGSMRDALSLTDQAIGHGGGHINEVDVSAMLGTIERRFVVDICQALASQSGVTLLSSIANMAEQSPDYGAAMGDILSVWHQVAILQTVPEALDRGLSHFTELASLAETVSREDVQLFYQICLLGRKDLNLAPDQRSGFEMAMLRALAFRPATNGPAIAVSPVIPEVDPPVKKFDAAEVPVASNQPPQPLTTSIIDEVSSVGRQGIQDSPEVSVTAEPECVEEDNILSKTAVETSDLADNIALDDFTPENWVDVRRQLTIGASLGEVASHCLYLSRQNNELTFIIDDQENSLYDSGHQLSLADALTVYFGQEIKVSINSGLTETETPRAVDRRETAERHAEAVDMLNQDPSVQRFKQLFDGVLDERSVQPID
ncbi:MAG TPA: DNA polymerase III subunit gamma/tau [Porticoccaceae bacterium]|nr:DNA polymerase III subunit gamma/tau [Porticoccaceae bacterium]HIK81175.1 DNA polymerase III subunit gamma/tau [Porticoccaceae bacterium]